MSGRDLFGDVSTVDTGERSAFDFYETPTWMTHSLLAFYPWIAGRRVLECCSGRDAIVRVLRNDYGCTFFTNDLNPAHPAETHFDARQADYWTKHAPPVDFVVTNLPFNDAIEILPHAVRHAQIGVATVLLKSFDEPTQDRGDWLSAHPWTFSVRQPRHSFRGEGSPAMASDWFIWEKGATAAVAIDHCAKSRTRRIA